MEKEISVDHQNIYYSLGQRDAIAALFSMIRSKGVDSALLELSEQYNKTFEINVHVEWWRKNNI